jgi:hypothetical protein
MRLRNGKELLVPGPDVQPFHRFLDLPAEIRVMIYGYTIGHGRTCLPSTLQLKNHLRGCQMYRVRRPKRAVKLEPQYTSLLRTCKFISQEALPVLLDATQLRVSVLPTTSRITSRYSILEKHVIQQFKHLIIDFGYLTVWELWRPNYFLRHDHNALESVIRLNHHMGSGAHLKTLTVIVRYEDLLDTLHRRQKIINLLRIESFEGDLIIKFPFKQPSKDDIVAFEALVRCKWRFSGLFLTR